MNSNEKSFLQIQVYTRKFFRTLKKESIVSIFMGVIITILVMYVTSDNMFETYEGTKSGLFSLICVCIWIGIFNSIQLVCREKKDIVKDELDKSLYASSYMAAHFIYQFLLCIIQSMIVFVIFYLFLHSKLEGNPISYLMTIFLVMYASDTMAFVISAAVPNPIVAMTIMPLLLLIQLVMAGVLFELDGMADTVASFTVSKWGMMAFGRIGDITGIPMSMEGKKVSAEYQGQKLKGIELKGLEPNSTDQDMYSCDGLGDILICWLCFIAFVIVFYFLSVAALKFTTRKMKK